MSDITHRTIGANGIKMHIAEAGQGPLVLLLHGFPELWYSWRHQLPALAAAGYHAVAPDVRGYGGTDAPAEVESYSMLNHTADAVGVLDALGERMAVVVGHDWGAPIAWDCALLYPERFPAVVALSVSYIPRSPAPPIQLMKQMFADNFFYILYFQEPGVAEAELEVGVRRTMRLLLYNASGEAPQGAGLSQKPKEAKLLGRLPDPFAVFRHIVPWVVRFGFPPEGWGIEPVEDSEDCVAFDIHRCIYLDTLTSYGAPELTPLYCGGDDTLFAALPPAITWERTMTLGRGDERCDFRWCRAVPQGTILGARER